MAIASILAAALLAGSPQEAQPRSPPPAAVESQDPTTTTLEEVVVGGERLDDAAEAFVRSVAAPIGSRKLAIWRDPICVGVAGMEAEAAGFMADRVSDWAHSLGLTIANPGCVPNIFIVATDDGDATAREMAETRPTVFRPGVGDADQGEAALRAFQSSSRPIRWWHVSLAVDGWTGDPIRRLPGEGPFVAPDKLTSPADFGSYGSSVMGSRLADHSQDDLIQVIVIIESSALDRASFVQITDYVAMVALAQVDPGSEPGHPSILSLFSPSEFQEETLTHWDQAYLRALYGTTQRSGSTGSNLSTIADALRRELERPAE